MTRRGVVQPDVSVIIPSLNSRLIDKTLDSILAQTVFDRIAEILVIGMDEPGLVGEAQAVRFISTRIPVTAPVGRNIGLRAAMGTLFVFIDADCIAEPTWLATLLAAHEEGGLVVGGSVSLEGSSYWQL